MRKALLFITVCCFITQMQAQELNLYEAHSFNTKTAELPYRLLRPIKSGQQKYPVVIFLHGAYEKGTDNVAQLNIGGRFFARDSIRNNYPAFVVFPQCPVNDVWADFTTEIDSLSGIAKSWRFPFRNKPTPITSALLELIDTLRTDAAVDVSRIYIAGLSQGAMGVLDIIARRPDVFAAGISICGAGNISSVKRLKDKTALWLFHGDKDDVVPVEFSKKIYKQLTGSTKSVRYSEYTGVGHAAWVNAFKEPELMKWLFSQAK